MSAERPASRLDWLEALRAFALFGVLLNHLVEEFGPGPWFTNPSHDWPDLATRLSQVFPEGHGPLVSLIQFLGWLGDSGPGVFIFASGFGLAWGALQAPALRPWEFYRKRLLRIFPLYLAAHLLILGLALFVPGSELTLASPRTLLSLLGLRFTSALFFFLSPSWWFVWLILQLYLVFPVLDALLRRAGPARFLALTWAFTFVCRGLGLLGLIPAGNLYFWMTGLFFGTRLAEFSAGMAAAALLRERGEAPGARRVLCWSLPVYALGFAASLTWPGTIVSNLLVTLGLCGLFFAAWSVAPARGFWLWVGAESYGVYLIHQPALHWMARGFGWGGALLAIAASFPAAALLGRLVARASRPPSRAVAIAAALGAIALLLAEAAVSSPRRHAALALLLGLAGGTTALAADVPRALRYAVVTAAFVCLFVLPHGLGPAALGIALPAGLVAAAVHSRTRSALLGWGAAACVAAGTLAIAEGALRRWAPIEAGRWGEYPVLEPHPTRVYALKPNRETHLRYENYDYSVKTNALGLVGPEPKPQRPTPDTLRVLVIGDAFSMPEGLDYERGYPALLQKRLEVCLAPRPVEVIDAAVTGYGPVEEVAQLRELAPLLHPDVVVYEFFVNEFSEALLAPAARRAEIGFPGGGEASLRDRLQVVAHARRLQIKAVEAITGRPGAWRGGKALLQYHRAGTNDVYSPASVAALRGALQAMDHDVREAGAQLLVFFVPAAVAVSRSTDLSYWPWDQDLGSYDLGRPLRELRAIAEPIGVKLIDLTPALAASPRQPVYFRDSWHWNEAGHEAAAAAVARALAEAGHLGPRCAQP